MHKLYYSIREVSELLDEEQHILRYWEKEFEQLKPKKNRGGNRIYSDKDILILKTIKRMLREDKLSLKGAKEQLSKMNLSNIDEHFNLNFDNLIDYSESVARNKLEEKDTIVLKSNSKEFTKEEIIELIKLLNNTVEFLKQI
jgi:DNA-binding transcriptional MerR regulator